jgi:hypothetical protein
MNYKNKYLKYKYKYNDLKNQIGGSKKTQHKYYNYTALPNSGVPWPEYNKRLLDYRNQCFFISILDYFYHIRKTPPIYHNAEYSDFDILHLCTFKTPIFYK